MLKCIFWIFIISVFLSIVVKDFQRIGKQIDREDAEKKEKQRKINEQKRKEAMQKIELQKQLAAIQYQLKLLEKLDDCINHDSFDEKELKKQLCIETKTAALYKKERELKRKIETL